MTVAKPLVRRAGPSDAAACANIIVDWLEATPWITPRFTRAELTGLIRDGLAIREIYVAGDPVTGYLSFNPEADHVVALYTAQPGQGVGKALMDHVKVGRSYLQLWTHEPNTSAHRFYSREGFEVVERKVEGDDGLPELRMEWRA
ncbi:MAG: GNAT family N-acetyltransferase [Pseudomonadota bacterium]